MSEPFITLPEIPGWPYVEIRGAINESPQRPKYVLVGGALWSMLIKSCDANQFFAEKFIQIRKDKTGVLEPHEFMVVR